MTSRKLYFLLAFVVFAASACDSGNDDETDSGTRKHPKGDDASSYDSGIEELADGEADSGGGGTGPSFSLCGNGKVDLMEDCDDGNLDDRDGCTVLCTFSCTGEDDTSCSDGNPCNGTETCGTDKNEHACNDDVKALEDGDSCGDSDSDKSCFNGICIANVCGDGKTTGNEQCDDGDLDPDNGCTPDCEYSCSSDDDCSSGDSCLGDRTCEHHACVGGSKLEDKSECIIVDTRIKEECGSKKDENDGWCMNGMCTCTDCGDGEIDGKEECDDGEFNGTEDSPNHCSINCRVVACGNGSVEGDEECDDGNEIPLDGCDENCKYEFAHRLTSINILKMATAPDWCVTKTDRFSEAFATELKILNFISVNVLDMVNSSLSNESAGGNNNFILHVMDSPDTTMRTVADEITIGAYQGNPFSYDATTIKELDQPFIIKSTQVDPTTRKPAELHSIPARQAGGGLVMSRAPTTIEMQGIMGPFKMYDYMAQLVFDTTELSSPRILDTIGRDTIIISDNIRLPEYGGKNPQGLFCGAMDPAATNRPIVNGDISGIGQNGNFGPAASMCCKNRAGASHDNETGEGHGKYRECTEGKTPPNDCDSITQLIREGCTACIDLTGDITQIASTVTGGSGSDCGMMTTNPSNCFQIIKSTDFDVDTDGDGTNDAWSVVFGFDTMRVRIFDVAVKRN
jgi:cysteine-rich repeat protein